MWKVIEFNGNNAYTQLEDFLKKNKVKDFKIIPTIYCDSTNISIIYKK